MSLSFPYSKHAVWARLSLTPLKVKQNGKMMPLELREAAGKGEQNPDSLQSWDLGPRLFGEVR